jgi:hypothetical protein
MMHHMQWQAKSEASKRASGEGAGQHDLKKRKLAII